MKKIISLILAAAILLAIGVTAFAETSEPEVFLKTLDFTVVKVWQDEGVKHPAVTMDIYCKDTIVKTVVLSEENNWTETVNVWNGELYNMGAAMDELYKYSVKERPVAGYVPSSSGGYDELERDDENKKYTATYRIYNEPLKKVEIPVTVTVKKTGTAEPGIHTFYYDLAILADSPIIYSNEISTHSENEKQWDYTVSYTGDLKGSGNGFSVTAKGEGTYSGSIIIEAEDSAFWHLRGRINKRAGVTAPRGWTYDETVYGFRTTYFYHEGEEYPAPTYDLYKIGEQYASGEEWLGTVPAAYVNEYKADRIYNESTVIKIESKNENEQNPNTGASVYGIVAAVIALGAAAVALKVRK